MKLQKIVSLNPGNNYAIIGEIASSSRDEIDTKLAAAKKAQPAWAALSIPERVRFLEPLYQSFSQRKKDIALLVAQEMGMPISIGLEVDVGFGLNFMRGYLDFAQQWLAPEIVFENEHELHYTVYEPRGVAGVSVPWNYPFCNFIWGVMQNLVVGNTVLFKHSEECPFTAKLLDEIMKTANLPDGVFNQVYGDGADVGEYVMNSDIDLIHFTGSTGVGKHLYQVAAKKFIPAILELGGSAPGIIFDDADIASAAASVYLYRFINNGQTCDAIKRLLVQRSCFNEVVSTLKKIIITKKIGNPEDPTTDLGPLAAQRQLKTLEAQVADALAKGAEIIMGGKYPPRVSGAYYEPTVLTNISRDMRVWKEEVFGPVLPIVPFDTEQEAIELANDSDYGLGGYIYTKNKERALRVASKLRTGNISINDTLYVIPQDPFGGYTYSGLGREHGKQGLQELCNTKLIAHKKLWG